MKKPILLDGAMGTELIKRGLELPLPIWSADANLTNPEIVTQIHQDYIDLGVDVITTNTFRSTAWAYRKSGYSENNAKFKSRESLKRAIECAQNVKGPKIIAGSITTIDDCYKPELYPGNSIAYDHYFEIIDVMINSGVDILLFETMGNISEISIVLDVMKSFSIEIWLSMIFKDKYLLDGNPIEKVIELAKKNNVNALLNNCNQLNMNLSNIHNLKSKWINQWGIYPNLGVSDYTNDFFETVNVNTFSRTLKILLEMGPDIIGLCCGSSINDLKKLKKIIEENKYES